VAEYKGLTVEDITNLRVSLKKTNLDFKVVKNTLAKRAAEGTALAKLGDSLSGQVGIAIGYDDPVALTKAVLDYAKTKPDKFNIRAGIIEGGLCGVEDLKSVASLPGREVLLGQIAGALQAPTQKMAGLLANTVTRFAFALEALRAQKEAQA